MTTKNGEPTGRHSSRGADKYVGASGSHFMRGGRRRLAVSVALLCLLPFAIALVAFLITLPRNLRMW